MTKEQKLMNRPVEEETTVLMEDLVNFDQFIGLMELWRWDGITASSIVLLLEDVAGFDQAELINLVFSKMKRPVDPNATFSIHLDYVYINYDFKVS
jgi:hypothetical protein